LEVGLVDAVVAVPAANGVVIASFTAAASSLLLLLLLLLFLNAGGLYKSTEFDLLTARYR